MSFCFSIKLGVPQPPHLAVLPAPVSNDKKVRHRILTLPSNGTHGGKGAQSAARDETHKQSHFQPLVDLLRDCVDKRSVEQAKAVHGLVLKSDFSGRDLLVLLNHVAHTYSKCSGFDAALRVFDKMSERNVFSWTVMIVGSTENGFFLQGFQFFCEMMNLGILPDGFAYSSIMQTCIGLDCVELGKMVHALIVIRGFASHTFVSTSLLNMYAKLGMIEDSYKVFETMTEHNQVSWNAMISGFTLNGLHLEAFDHFLRMKKGDITPNMYTLISVSKAVGNLGDIGKGKEVHKYVSELGLESNVLVGTALMDMFSKCGSLSEARSILYSNFINCGVNTPWNAMISGYSQCGFSQEALELFQEMSRNDIKSDVYTYCSVFNAIAALMFLQFGKGVHGMVLKCGLNMNVSVSNAIADAYAKCESLEDVRKVFDRMEERDIVSWTTLLTAYSQCSEWEEALAIFSRMREEGFIPNQFTLSSVLVACTSLCLLEYGHQVHSLLCKAGLDTDKCIESALIDMYAKCGSITEACKVFERISNPDTITWTAVISGCAQHGLMEDAIQLFRRMDQSGVKPNAVTLLCVLFACSHGGMVEEGLNYFQQMEDTYGLVPKMEHYACVVDLLGRVGRLDDAMKFIQRMPIEPNVMVWQTLLGACRVHGNVELGEIAAQKILSIMPEFSATYVLLSNTYIEAGSYEDGLILRDRMKEQGVKKEAGYSWISVNGRIHKFYAGDQQHPQKEHIYAKLEDLRVKIKSMGYVPDLSYVLRDADRR
ncbi:pentatricopeptide repeat-containing protein At2g33680-like [Corylus avellana]|uniref:pentatricopeptide repeat-containing protein At2g33680-like n=1 Tax=Corylus avellana TaxID=13451 RepID=UPI00286C9847|nr:pentatricopeptide repeat-containing protein At2g33680-like [Corylus avellana]